MHMQINIYLINDYILMQIKVPDRTLTILLYTTIIRKFWEILYNKEGFFFKVLIFFINNKILIGKIITINVNELI